MAAEKNTRVPATAFSFDTHDTSNTVDNSYLVFPSNSQESPIVSFSPAPHSGSITPMSFPHDVLGMPKPGMSVQQAAIDLFYSEMARAEETMDEITSAREDEAFVTELTAIEDWFRVLVPRERTATVYALLQNLDQSQIRFFITLLNTIWRANTGPSTKQTAILDLKNASMFGNLSREHGTFLRSPVSPMRTPLSASAHGISSPLTPGGGVAGAKNSIGLSGELSFTRAGARVMQQGSNLFTQQSNQAPIGTRPVVVDQSSSPMSAIVSNSSIYGSARPHNLAVMVDAIPLEQTASQSGLYPDEGTSGIGGTLANHLQSSMKYAKNLPKPSTIAQKQVPFVQTSGSYQTVPLRPVEYRPGAESTPPTNSMNFSYNKGKNTFVSPRAYTQLSPASGTTGRFFMPKSAGFRGHQQNDSYHYQFPSSLPHRPFFQRTFSPSSNEASPGGSYNNKGVSFSPTNNSRFSPIVRRTPSQTNTPEWPRVNERIDFNLLESIPIWLRSMRLHKYTDCFLALKLNWRQIILMTDEDLERVGVLALGARTKFIKVFAQIHLEIEELKLGKNCPSIASPITISRFPLNLPNSPNSPSQQLNQKKGSGGIVITTSPSKVNTLKGTVSPYAETAKSPVQSSAEGGHTPVKNSSDMVN